MRTNSKSIFYVLFILFMTSSCSGPKKDKIIVKEDPLPSWNEGALKSSIVQFVESVTDSSSQDYIRIPDRIATLDNDGTLWSERPVYFQLYFAMDRIKEMAKEHPEWKDQEPFKSVLANDLKSLGAQGVKGLLELVSVSHANVTAAEFEVEVKEWLSKAKHPTKNRPYTDLVFQPMLELVSYLKENQFKVFIVSGGGIDFMRPWVEEVYGIPQDQVIGSSIKTEYHYNEGKPFIWRLPEIDFIDDKEGKPEGIHKHIGRVPVIAFGNSDGDLEMLRWCNGNELKSAMYYVHHTDSIREWSYDRDSHIGQLNKGLDEAVEKGWGVIDMAKDWKVIYPFELEEN